MPQPTAPLTLSVVVQVLGRDFTQNPATTVEKEESLSLNSTAGNYSTDVPAFASQIYTRYQSLLVQAGTGSALTAVHGQIVINDVTGATPPGPYYNTFEGAATPVSKPQENQHFRASFELGQFDFTDATSLSSSIVTSITQFINSIGY